MRVGLRGGGSPACWLRRRRGRRSGHHESIAIGDRVEPAYQPEFIIVLENEDAAVYFPPVPKGISVEGEGCKAPGTIPLIPWMSQCPHVVYWGDIDAKGLCIVNDLRTKGIKVDTMLMDYATYEAYGQCGAWTDEKGKPIPCSPRRSFPALTPDEHLLYLHLTGPA